MGKISSGSQVIDKLLEGGIERDIITTIYGPAGSGKTNMCLLCAIDVAKEKERGKVIYIDTDGSFSVERLKQLNKNYKELLNNIFFLKPTNFNEQKESFKKLRELAEDKIGLIIVDSISMLYRLEIGKTEYVYNVNKELGLQLGYLTEVARKKNIPILLTNQVYADFEDKNKVNMVGGDLLKYGSKCLIELKKFGKGIRECIVRKHRSISEDKTIYFRIVEKGIEEYEINKLR